MQNIQKNFPLLHISLINKKDNKKYSSLSEVTRASQLEFSSFPVDSKRLVLWVDSEEYVMNLKISNEFMVKLTEKIFNDSSWMDDSGICKIEGQEKTWECSIQESKTLSKVTQANQLILNSNYYIFASPEIRLKGSELTGKKISFSLNISSSQQNSNSIFKFNFL